MVFMLLPILFVIALAMTLAGLRLSHKTQPPVERRRASGSLRGRPTTEVSYVTPVTYRRTRPPVMVEEPRSKGGRNRGNRTVLSRVKALFLPGEGRSTRWLNPLLLLLVAVFGCSLFALRSFLPGATSVTMASWMVPTSTALPSDASMALQNAGSAQASGNLIRLAQLDASQYSSSQEYNTWAASACSATSMTEVIDSYGHNYRITDILKVEVRLGEISSELGLLEPQGIERTVAEFGFKTTSLNNASLDTLIAMANQGHPVIVGFPPSRWTGGHILVVKGGDAHNVFLADSAPTNLTSISRDRFMHYWGGFAVVVLPKDA